MTLKQATKTLIIGYLSLFIISGYSNTNEQVKKMKSEKFMKTWQEHKFSLFIHWGIYSIPAGMWNGEKVKGYSEQIKGHAKIESEDYRKLALEFNPDKWNADSVALLAKESGMKSIVITSKHHDGFCMFDTEYTSLNVVDATPYKRDIVAELAAACKKHGLEFGVYFSTIDWDFSGALPFTSVNNSDSIPPLHHQYNLKQIEELMTNYGDISEFWFDMGSPTFEQSKEMAALIKKIQPNCLVSGRIWNDQGDFVVMGDNYKPTFKMGVPWQTPASMFNETWSYRSWQERPNVDEKVKEKINDLINIVSSGGNFLLNIGPKANGEIVPFEKQVLAGVGKWLKENGEAIYATNVSPIAKQDWGFITTKNNKLYLHLIDFPKDNKLSIDGLKTIVKNAYPLSNIDLKLKTSISEKGLDIYLSDKIRKDAFVSVIVLEYAGSFEYSPPNMIKANKEDNNFVLTLANAEKYHSLSGHDYYSTKATVVKMKWTLPANTKDVSTIEIISSEKITNSFKLSVNNVEYFIATPSSADSSKNNIIQQTINNLNFYTDKINTIELTLEDKSNPHKDLNIKEISICIK